MHWTCDLTQAYLRLRTASHDGKCTIWTFITLPGQRFIFNVRVYILFEKPKPLKYTTSRGTEEKKKTAKQNENKEAKCHSLPFPLLLLVLTGRCSDRGEGAAGGRAVPVPRPCRGAVFAHAGGELNFPGLDSEYFFNLLCMCACVYVCICIRVCACACVFIHTYINIYIYVLKWISFPAVGSLEAHVAVGSIGLALHCSLPACLGPRQADPCPQLSALGSLFSLFPPTLSTTSSQEVKRRCKAMNNSQT